MASGGLTQAHAADAVTPERRLVTVLFADLAGYTALCARLDPEDVHDVVRPAMRSLRSVAESFGAIVPGIQGDGFLAIFGAPLAHEDDAERAVRAAFALQQTLRDINAAGAALQVPDLHIGINSGEVAVWCGDGDHDVSIAGEAVNLASRLCGLAAPGQVRVGLRTVELTRGRVEFSAPEVMAVRGVEAPVEVFTALRINPDAFPGRRTMSLRSGFVGRASILRELDVILQRVRESRSSEVVVVIGDAGNGKSRLALEWCASYDDIAVISVGCSPYDDDPLAPWTAIAPIPGVRSDSSALDDEPGTAQLHAVHEYLRSLAADRAVVMVLDDLHWAAPEAVRLLDSLHAASWPVPVLVLGLARPDGWTGTCRALPLGPLDDDETRELLVGALGDVEQPVAEALIRRSGGNPLFLEECLQLLVESGALLREGESVALDPAQVEQIPNSMRQFIAARLDALPPAERSVVQDASVAGDVVWDEWLRQLDPQRDVDPLLASLEQRGLLRRTSSVAVGGSAEHVFKHALIRDVAYESLSRRRRAVGHRSLADWLGAAATAPGAVIPAALLAHHYATGWELAASDAAAKGAPPCDLASAAVRHLAHYAATLASGHPRRAEGQLTRALAIVDAAPGCFTATVRADLAVSRAAARFDLQDHHAALDDLDAAELVVATDDDPARRGRARLVRAQTLSLLSRVDEASPVFDEALDLLQAAGDGVLVAHALRQQAYAARLHDHRTFLAGLHRAHDAFVAVADREGQRDVAIDLAYELTPVGGPSYRRWYAAAESATDLDTEVRARAALRRTAAFMAQHRGENRAALDLSSSAYADAVAVGATRVTVDALICRLAATSDLGLVEDNERAHADALELASRLGLRRFEAMAHIHAVRPKMLARDVTTARDRLRRGRELLGRLGATLNRDADIAEVVLGRDTGDWVAAVTLGERVIAALERDSEDLYAVPVRVHIGRAALGLDPEAALDVLAEALDAARRQDAPQHGVVAAALLEQAQLLTGRPTSHRIGVAPEQTVELTAVAAETSGLRSVGRGDWAAAAAGFGQAVDAWSSIGASVWLARAMVWQQVATERAGGAAAPESAEVVAALLRDLGAPAGTAEALATQLAEMGPG